jgi:hypothetical protein
LTQPYLVHLAEQGQLVTTYAETRAGFVQMALEKNRRAVPYIEEARALKADALTAKKPMDLLNIDQISPALLSASGLSDKALNHLQKEDKDNAIKGLIEEFLEPAGDNFVDELVYRFLLIKGDSLGGKMRNLAGMIAETKLKRAIIASLNLYKFSFQSLHAPSKKWIPGEKLADDVDSISGFSWKNGDKTRVLIFNKTVPLVRNNIDVCILKSTPQLIGNDFKNPDKYIALGELKGGIDPAGADEHWKTARTAIMRISDSFNEKGLSPKTFFIGAAIENRMAEEIWGLLKKETLSNAGNLTDSNHVASICNWLSRV